MNKPQSLREVIETTYNTVAATFKTSVVALHYEDSIAELWNLCPDPKPDLETLTGGLATVLFKSPSRTQLEDIQTLGDLAAYAVDGWGYLPEDQEQFEIALCEFEEQLHGEDQAAQDDALVQAWSGVEQAVDQAQEAQAILKFMAEHCISVRVETRNAQPVNFMVLSSNRFWDESETLQYPQADGEAGYVKALKMAIKSFAEKNNIDLGKAFQA